ncbi:hypothetical protein BC830DRAFT_1117138, partial [Chytriomyces sp. MP71]
MLAHFGDHCPGLSDHKARSDIFRQTLFQVFHSHARLEIPIMQRRFCWDEATLSRWIGDALTSVETLREEDLAYDELDLRTYPSHAVRNCKMARFRLREDGSSLVVIDGQQRLTASSLLVAAIRDRILASDGPVTEHAERALRVIHAVLFSAPCALESVAAEAVALPSGEVLATARLIPSYPDRRAFYILVARNGHSLLRETAPAALTSHTAVARRLFDDAVQSLTLSQLCRLTYSALCQYSCMSNYLIAPNLNLSQMFQWFQELQINNELAFGRSRNSGISFNTMDFTRNLFMSVCVDYDLGMQTWMYKQLWFPIEQATNSDSAAFDILLEQYIALYSEGMDDSFNERIPKSILRAQSIKREGLLLYIQLLMFYYRRVNTDEDVQTGDLPRDSIQARIIELQSMVAEDLEVESKKGLLGFIVHFTSFCQKK